MAERGLAGTGSVVVPVGVDRGEVARWLAASCEAQGVPVRIVDPLIVRNVVTLLDGRARERSSRPVPQPPTRTPEPDPNRADPLPMLRDENRTVKAGEAARRAWP